MKSRVARAVVVSMAVGVFALAVLVLAAGHSLSPATAGGPGESFLLLFSNRLMARAFPHNFSLPMQVYAVAVMLAAALSLVLTLRPQQSQTGLLLGRALSGISFFTCHLVLGRHVLPESSHLLLYALDYAAMAAFAFGLHAMVRIALCYPHSIDAEAYFAYCLKEISSKQLRELMPTMPTFAKKLGDMAERWDAASLMRLQFNVGQSIWFPRILTVAGCLLVALSPPHGTPDIGWLEFAGFALFVGAGAVALSLTSDLLRWQYRLADQAERNRLMWALVGVFVLGLIYGACCSWSVIEAFIAKVGSSGDDRQFMAKALSLTPPLTAIAILLLVGCSIFLFGAIDPRLAIRKTSVYGMAALLLAVALAAAQSSVVAQIVAKSGLPGHTGSIVAGAAVALVFAPMRKRIETSVERAVDRVLPASALAEARRETVTVVFADLSGYTELSAKDEAKALTLASLLHKESRRLTERHGGRLVKTIGDAVLLAFPDAGEAVVACTELRDKFAVAVGALDLPALPLHFGLHSGEVVRDQDGDIFGGTVNLAARLQGVAHAGEIVLSATVAAALAGGNFTLQPLGEKILKNVPAPVNCFLVA